jgi:ABC-2 type transport system ATP-binding protein
MINVENLTKNFKKRDTQKNNVKKEIVAVDHLNLEIKKGEIFGLIGPNGAGKTTLLKILSTLIIPDEGTATIDGYDVVKDASVVKNKVSLLAGEFVRSLYWRLDGRQNMKFFANLRNIWDAEQRIDELMELFDLKDVEHNLVMKYSTGMKHKLALAVGLLSDPTVIFLDEPLTGIDAVTAYEIKKLIKEKYRDKTIIWTSHNLYEIEEMCDRIALINKGKIQLQGSPEDLKKNYWDYEKIMIICNNATAFAPLENSEIKDNVTEIKTKDVNKTLVEIMDIVKEKNVKIKEIKTVKPTLEEIFIKGMEDV